MTKLNLALKYEIKKALIQNWYFYSKSGTKFHGQFRDNNFNFLNTNIHWRDVEHKAKQTSSIGAVNLCSRSFYELKNKRNEDFVCN